MSIFYCWTDHCRASSNWSLYRNSVARTMVSSSVTKSTLCSFRQNNLKLCYTVLDYLFSLDALNVPTVSTPELQCTVSNH